MDPTPNHPMTPPAGPGAPSMSPDVQYSGLGRRSVAAILDLLIGLCWTIPFSEWHLTESSFSYRLEGWRFLVVAALWFVYFIGMEWAVGATIGKLVVGIRVRAEEGGRIGFGASLIRNVLRIVDGFPYIVPYLVGGIVASKSETVQRIGDRAGNTVVVKMGTDVVRPGSPPGPGGMSTVGTAPPGQPGFPQPPGASPGSPALPPPPGS